MTLGNLESVHHGECYRLYNLWRENNAHHYVVHGAFVPPVGPSWDELARHASDLSGWSKKPPGAGTPPEDIAPSRAPAATAAARGTDADASASAGCAMSAPTAARAPQGPQGPQAPTAAAVLLVLGAAALARRRRRAF
jgi:uncharacterized protein (TIGR03382 family)